MQRPNRSIGAVLTLFFLAPFVAEFLLGDIGLRALPALVVMAPMYGGGALLIREVVRRTGRGWPSIFLFGAAYTLIEEGFTTQSLFNPDYLHIHMHLLSHAPIPALHIGAWWTLFMFNLHTFWSISVSIALAEALFPARAHQPWLGRIGDAVIAILFLAGCVIGTLITLHGDPYISPIPCLVAAALLSVVFIILGFRIHGNGQTSATGAAPSPWLVAIATFILGSVILFTSPVWNWGAVAVILATDILFLTTLRLLSLRTSWTPLHTLATAAGGAVAYGIHAFTATPVFGGAGPIARIGNAIFLAIAAAIIAIGVRRNQMQMAPISHSS
jgi:hypothetical protein